jgi:hypothetical protein
LTEEPTNDADTDQQEESAPQLNEAVSKEEEEAEDDHQSRNGEVEDGNERFEVMGNNTPSSDKDIPNWHRRQFEDKVADAA